MYHFDWGVIGPALPHLLDGLKTTVYVSAMVIAISTVLGFPLALARMSRIEVVRWPAQLYIEIFRGTPMLVQLLWVYYALPALLGITIPPIPSVLIALSANLTAFLAESYRAGMQSVPLEQIEAAQTLRLSRLQIVRHIVIPQAFRQQIPTILSLDVSMFKDTSLISALGIADLTFQGNVISSQTYRPIEVYTMVAVMYFAVAFPLTVLTSMIERRMIRATTLGTPPATGLWRRLMPGYRPPLGGGAPIVNTSSAAEAAAENPVGVARMAEGSSS
jgi:polar amino acid transport system permease protein